MEKFSFPTVLWYIKNILYKVIYLINGTKSNEFLKKIFKICKNKKINENICQKWNKKLKTYDFINDDNGFNQN